MGNQSLISDWLENKTAEEVLDANAAEVLNSHNVTDEIEEYLLLKHFLAVRAGLSIMLGRESGSVENYCKLEAIRYSPNGTEIIAHISVEGMTDEIQACGNCGKH